MFEIKRKVRVQNYTFNQLLNVTACTFIEFIQRIMVRVSTGRKCTLWSLLVVCSFSSDLESIAGLEAQQRQRVSKLTGRNNDNDCCCTTASRTKHNNDHGSTALPPIILGRLTCKVVAQVHQPRANYLMEIRCRNKFVWNFLPIHRRLPVVYIQTLIFQ